MAVPDLIVQMQEKQMMAFFMTYYVGNMIVQNLSNTGAFEVTLNGKLVWSKIQEGGLPTWDVLVHKMNAAASA
jgi:selT/selW/selH-like putative selenoprotein